MIFFDDLKEHDAADEIVMLVFTEFGRRVKDNGNGTDHGSGGGAFPDRRACERWVLFGTIRRWRPANN